MGELEPWQASTAVVIVGHKSPCAKDFTARRMCETINCAGSCRAIHSGEQFCLFRQ